MENNDNNSSNNSTNNNNVQPVTPPAPKNELLLVPPTANKPDDPVVIDDDHTPNGQLVIRRSNSYIRHLNSSAYEYNKLLRRFFPDSKICSWDPNTPLKPTPECSKDTDQFKVMRDGRWYKIIYERDSAPVNIASDPYDVRNSQWLRRWKRSCENFANIYAHKDCFACGEIQFEFPKIDDPHGSDENAEGSGQNFVD